VFPITLTDIIYEGESASDTKTGFLTIYWKYLSHLGMQPIDLLRVVYLSFTIASTLRLSAKEID
jgi:hypothetical protein